MTRGRAPARRTAPARGSNLRGRFALAPRYGDRAALAAVLSSGNATAAAGSMPDGRTGPPFLSRGPMDRGALAFLSCCAVAPAVRAGAMGEGFAL